jgi:hypothetical protein
VEHFVDDLLPCVSGLKWEALEPLGVTEKNIQSKVQFLKVVAKQMGDSERGERVRNFCEAIEHTKVERNHLFHGIWGWRVNSRTKTVEPCARHSKFPSKPLKIPDLARLEKALCRCSRLGFNLLQEFWGWNENGAGRFFHGSDKDFPKWLQQWIERYPPNDEHLDQSAKEGQLPRLARAYPRK